MPPRDTGIVPIPEPRGLPYLGHINEFRSEDSLQDLDRLHDTYGEIFRLRFPGVGSVVFVGTHKLVNELCDEKRFKKSIQAEIAEARLATGDGLFTARDDEANWGIAHRILMPTFGPVSIRGMFDEMYDTATQMTLKWARLGSSNPIPASEDFTRLALDTLGLCSMGYRFNSFYKDDLHPFVQSMADSLVELGNRTQRPKWASIFYRSSERKLHKDINVMRRTSHELIKARKADSDSSTRRDLLTAMIEGADPRTGAKLSEESIINNLITFLVAGHETTSGTLSFAFYSMLKNPHTFQAAQQEVDSIMGRDRITVDKLFKLKYIPAVLRETLRQCSPIPGITLEAYEDTLLDGKYRVKKGEPIAAVFCRSHLDPAVYGEDASEFKPERTEALSSHLVFLRQPVLTAQLLYPANTTHLFVKLRDVYPDGTTRPISWSNTVLRKTESCPVRITLDDNAYRYRKGHRIQLHIAAFPSRCHIPVQTRIHGLPPTRSRPSTH
ncbi:hypothetical protein ACJZ2D_015949 [Fusarium nematophilum]